MSTSGTYLFAAALFLGVAVMILAGGMSAWWAVASFIVVTIGTIAFSVRALIEFRRDRQRAQ